MTKKPPPPSLLHPITTRHVLWMGLKFVVVLSVSLCLFALHKLHLQTQFQQQQLPLSVLQTSHALRDDNLFVGQPKIAFLFLTRKNLPLDFLWGSFFEKAEPDKFSIYVHSEPGYVLDKSTTRSHFFYGRHLRDSIKVSWGESSMIKAERRLFAAALKDPANQRFVLLSDSCVPLYNFSDIYNYLMASPRSYVDSFVDPKDDRYNPRMSPIIPKDRWRKGSQVYMAKTHWDLHATGHATWRWITLIRRHAEVVVDDELIFPVFERFCKPRLPADVSKGKLNLKLQKQQHNCISDEHYVSTLLAMNGLEAELERRTVTYTLWNQSAAKMEEKSWHPATFTYANAGAKQINDIKSIRYVYYEVEYRTEWCKTNSISVPCFLFARKFSRGAAMRLLSEGVVGPFDTMRVFNTPL